MEYAGQKHSHTYRLLARVAEITVNRYIAAKLARTQSRSHHSPASADGRILQQSADRTHATAHPALLDRFGGCPWSEGLVADDAIEPGTRGRLSSAGGTPTVWYGTDYRSGLSVVVLRSKREFISIQCKYRVGGRRVSRGYKSKRNCHAHETEARDRSRRVEPLGHASCCSDRCS